MEDGACSLEQRKRAVEPCIRYGIRATAAIRELGYPSRAQLAGWHREWQENGGRLTDRSLEHCTLEQKRAAVRHHPAHGRRDALARRGLGYPKCTAKLAERTDEYAPGERRATQPRAFDSSEKAAAVKPLASRASSAQEVADLVGCTRSALYKQKREPLREESPMSEDRPSKPARTRGRSPATQADIAALEARKAELEAELEELKPGCDIMEGTLEALGKGRAPTRQTNSRMGRRPCRSGPCVPNGGCASFSRRSGWPGPATGASRERSVPPTGTRRPAGGSRRSSTPTAASTEGAALAFEHRVFRVRAWARRPSRDWPNMSLLRLST